MTKQHFSALAKALAESEIDDYGFEDALIAVSKVCAEFNDSFDSKKFFAYAHEIRNSLV